MLGEPRLLLLLLPLLLLLGWVGGPVLVLGAQLLLRQLLGERLIRRILLGVVRRLGATWYVEGLAAAELGGAGRLGRLWGLLLLLGGGTGGGLVEQALLALVLAEELLGRLGGVVGVGLDDGTTCCSGKLYFSRLVPSQLTKTFSLTRY